MMAEGTYELHPGDALYPEIVLELSDVPQTLYVRGNPEVLSTPAVSIIGARKASPYGLAVAELAAKVAVEAGVTVVSGGAVGCDQASGWAAVNAGGKHVVVLGTGADVVYPRSSAGLITRTLDTGGAVVSISPWGMGPRKFAFPRRNRVIAALSQALFVSEAGMPSGTFSTAEAAMDLGRELLAVPGSILSPESRGTNYLIANGACCIIDEESIEMAISRIYGTLRYSRPDAPGIADLDQTQQTVMHALIASPLKVDDIAALVSLDTVGVLKLLGSLELEGLIERMMDGRYAPSKFALHAQTPFGHNGKRVN
ncbi:DNA-processing protein DprA [Collinsella sp. OM06-18AC]|uniref:DNA-processing protein DprA n=1 Tax=Collinsella sp. OM06-18AC TaxID=2292327 RepID=UPI003511B048